MLPVPPDRFLPLPEGCIYLGPGKSFKTGNKTFTGYTANSSGSSRDWVICEGLYGTFDVLHYAVPYDSEIARLNGFPEISEEYEFAGWKPYLKEHGPCELCAYVPYDSLSFIYAGMTDLRGNASAYYFTRKETGKMSSHRYNIDRNGNVDLFENDCHVAELSAESVAVFIKWLNSAPVVCGERPRFATIQFGCQTFTDTEMDGFVEDYISEEWKKPEETYTLGSKFRWPHNSNPNAVYVLCSAGQGKAILVNPDTGGRLCDAFNLNLAQREWTLQEIIDAADNFDIMDLQPAY